MTFSRCLTTFLITCSIVFTSVGSNGHVFANDAGSQPTNGSPVEKFLSDEAFLNELNELSCECFWEDMTHSTEGQFNSADHCKDSMLTDESELQELASCSQSVFDDSPEMSGSMASYFECTTRVLDNGSACIKEVAAESPCSEDTQHRLTQCEVEVGASLESECGDILSEADMEWLSNLRLRLSRECPI